MSLYFPRRTSLSAKNRYHILQRRLKADPGQLREGVFDLSSPTTFGSWQDMLLWPERTGRLCLNGLGSTDQLPISCPAPIAANEVLPAALAGENDLVSVPEHTDWFQSLSDELLPDGSSSIDVEPLGLPFLRDRAYRCSLFIFNNNSPLS